MNLFKFLSLKQNKDSEQRLSPDFKDQVKKAIALYSEWELSIDDEEVLSRLVANGIDGYAAIEILLFLPIVFVRHWLPNASWPDTYHEYVSAKKIIERKYTEDNAFVAISEVANEYFKNSPNSDTVFKIGARSAELDAINKLLSDDPNARLEDINISPTVILR